MLLYEELSNKVLDAARIVHRSVGPGLLETVYQNAMEIEFDYQGIEYEVHKKHLVPHRKRIAGYYESDLLICNTILIEVKSEKAFCPNDYAQIINYMRIAKKPVGYLINFRNKFLEFKRFVLSEFA